MFADASGLSEKPTKQSKGDQTVFAALRGVKQFLVLGLISLLLAGCGGSSGGFTGPDESISVTVRTADGNHQVDWNPTLAPLDSAAGYAKALIIEVRDRQQGRLVPTEELEIRLLDSGGRGALCVPFTDLDDGDQDSLGSSSGLNCGAGFIGPLSRVVYKQEPFRSSAEVFFLAANRPGSVEILVTARNLGGDETPLSTRQVEARITLNVIGGAGPIAGMSFTGPFIDAIRVGEFETAIAPGEALQDGSYSRVVSVVATDADGNPPPVGTPINFFLIDGPLSGYPVNPGSFIVAGNDGDPVEEGFQFFANSGQFVSRGVLAGDRLVLDGQNFDQQPNNRRLTGIRTITDVVNQTSLNIDPAGRPFNANPVGDTGASVPYVVGRPEQGNILARATTDATGVASTLLTYPVTAVGRTALLVACTVDRSVCSVLNTCNATGGNCGPVYLPVAAESFTISPTELGPNTSTPVTMCLRDPNRVPVSFAGIGYSIGPTGGATVSVNGNTAATGVVTTGSNGCVTVTIASSGQLPGSDDIVIEFTPSELDLEAQQVTIKAPGPAEILASAISCRNQDGSSKICINPEDTVGSYECQVELLVQTQSGQQPVSDAVVSHTSNNPLGGISYSPAFGSFGITGLNGRVVATVIPDPFNQPTVTFESVGASRAVALILPNCEGVPGEPVGLPEASLIGQDATLAPGGSLSLAVTLDAPAPNPLEINLVVTGDTGQFTVPSTVVIPEGASSAPLLVMANASAPEGARIQIRLASGVGYALGAPGPVTVEVATEEPPGLPVVAFVGQGNVTVAPGGTVNFAIVLNEAASSPITINLLVTGALDQFQEVPSTIVIGAGQSTASISVTAVSVNAVNGATLAIDIVSGQGYTLGSPVSRTATLVVE